MAWDKADSAHLAQLTKPLEDDHIQMAKVLDALYKHHFDSTFGPDSIASLPSDEDFQAVLSSAFGPQAPQEIAPRARETMEILYRDFDELALFRGIPAKDRWRLLVDRSKVAMLGEHGVDTTNPLLAFLFDGGNRDDRGYAHSMATGLKFMAQCIVDERELDAELILDFADKCAATGLTAPDEIEDFGACYTDKGAAELAAQMLRLRDRYEIGSMAASGHKMVKCDRAGTYIGNWTGQFPSFDSMWRWGKPTTGKTLVDLVNENFPRANPTKGIAFTRNKATRETLMSALNDIVDGYRQNAAAASSSGSSDDRIIAAATAYHEGEHLHPLTRGNFRVFGKLLLNFLLAKQGEPLAEIYDPWTSDGNSLDELVDVIKEGQAWLGSLARATTD